MSYQARFAALFAQGAEAYSDSTKPTQASGNPFLDNSDADLDTETETTETTDAGHTYAQQDAQPIIVNVFTIAAAEMLAQFADEDEDELQILAPAIIEATAPTKPKRTYRF
jgi:hypothetical protein